ncbi:MAG: sugar phosphate isomerase/epimerase family protein [Armatimonadota bacterium]
MTIGNATYSVRDYLRDGRLKLTDFAQFNADLGVTALEYNDMFFETWDGSYLAEVRASAEKAGCRIVCLTCGGSFCSDDEAERRQSVHTIARRLQDAKALGAGVIRANVGRTGDEQRDGTVGVQRAIKALDRLVPLCREHNVRITIENHGGASKRADWILKMILSTDPQWIGTCPDLGNFPAESRYLELAKVLPYAYHVHMKSHEFDDRGEETATDFGRVVRMLKDCDNAAVLSIEFEGSGDQVEGVKKTKALIERYL